MTHPLVEQLRFARSEWRRSLAQVFSAGPLATPPVRVDTPVGLCYK
jgi:hypothetical protein